MEPARGAAPLEVTTTHWSCRVGARRGSLPWGGTEGIAVAADQTAPETGPSDPTGLAGHPPRCWPGPTSA